MVTIRVSEAKAKIRDIFVRVGVNEKEAAIISDMVTEADQRGVHSHGIICTARYVKLIREGRMKANMDKTVLRDNGAVAVWDGNRSSGQVLGYYAMEEAMAKAKQYGIGCVAVKGANHFGAAAYYAQMAQKEGMVGVTLATGDSTMAPWGGAEKAIGNNPIAVAVPTRDEVSPVLDMAQTIVANGKVTNLRRQGIKTIPEGWALDKEGMPTTNMDDFYTVPPMAGYKGWGSAFIIDILAGTLFGGGTGDRAKDAFEGPGLMMLAFNVDSFNDREKYLDDVDARIKELKSTRLAKNSKGILMPGEIEDNKFRETEKNDSMEVLIENLQPVNDILRELGMEEIAYKG